MSETTNPTPATFPPPPAPGVPPAPPVAYAAPVIRPVKSPAVAGVLSILPGVGHIYLGLYRRGLMFFVIWLLAMAIGGEVGGFPAFVIVSFWMLFVLIDAVRQAQAICCGQITADPMLPIETSAAPMSGSLGLGVFLILFGAFFILRRFVSIDLSFLRDWWPMLFVLFGLWQVFGYFKEKYATEKPRTDEPAV